MKRNRIFGGLLLAGFTLLAFRSINGAWPVETVRGLIGSSETDTEQVAVYALGNMDTEEATRALKDVLKSSRHAEVRKAAVYALGNIDTPAARSALVKILEKQSLQRKSDRP